MAAAPALAHAADVRELRSRNTEDMATRRRHHPQTPENTVNLSDTAALQHTEAFSRHDIYRWIHKALRARMCRVLVLAGSLDVTDPAALGTTLDAVDALLAQCRDHLAHENEFLHTAMEAVQPGSSQGGAADHVDHLAHIASLQADSQALRQAPDGAAALRLYHALALFVAENLAHMHKEETEHNAVLWRHCSDAQIQAIEQRLHASLPPAEMMDVLPWLATGLNATERAQLMQGMQQGMPAPVFEAALGAAMAPLNDPQRAQLSRALGRAPIPGLIRI